MIFGPRRSGPEKSKPSLPRFTFWERLIHAISLLSFLTLALTGFWAVFVTRSQLHGWLWMIHAAAGAFFAASIAFMALLWAMDCQFARHDWLWAKGLGGYFDGGKIVPAGRFNAGQKAYFWAIALLGLVMLLSGLGRMAPLFDAEVQETIYQIHRYGALLFLMAAIAHLYLATLANPGTFRSIILGTVGTEWARHHHPIWWEQIAETDEDRSQESGLNVRMTRPDM